MKWPYSKTDKNCTPRQVSKLALQMHLSFPSPSFSVFLPLSLSVLSECLCVSSAPLYQNTKHMSLWMSIIKVYACHWLAYSLAVQLREALRLKMYLDLLDTNCTVDFSIVVNSFALNYISVHPMILNSSRLSFIGFRGKDISSGRHFSSPLVLLI